MFESQKVAEKLQNRQGKADDCGSLIMLRQTRLDRRGKKREDKKRSAKERCATQKQRFRNWKPQNLGHIIVIIIDIVAGRTRGHRRRKHCRMTGHQGDMMATR